MVVVFNRKSVQMTATSTITVLPLLLIIIFSSAIIIVILVVIVIIPIITIITIISHTGMSSRLGIGGQTSASPAASSKATELLLFPCSERARSASPSSSSLPRLHNYDYGHHDCHHHRHYHPQHPPHAHHSHRRGCRDDDDDDDDDDVKTYEYDDDDDEKDDENDDDHDNDDDDGADDDDDGGDGDGDGDGDVDDDVDDDDDDEDDDDEDDDGDDPALNKHCTVLYVAVFCDLKPSFCPGISELVQVPIPQPTKAVSQLELSLEFCSTGFEVLLRLSMWCVECTHPEL